MANKNKENEVYVKALKEAFGFNKSQISIFNYVLKNKDTSVAELSKKFDKDRTTIQKILTSLHFSQVITRKKTIGTPTGYRFIYNVEIGSIETIVQHLKDKISMCETIIDSLNDMCLGGGKK